MSETTSKASNDVTSKRRWLRLVLGAMLLLGTGLVPPAAIGLGPCDPEMANRFVARGKGMAVGVEPNLGELIDRLGVGPPDRAELHHWLPGGVRESVPLLPRDTGEPQLDLVPADLPVMDASQAQWVHLSWRQSPPWLIGLMDAAARRVSPGAETIMWAVKERLPSQLQFDVFGTPEDGWQMVTLSTSLAPSPQELDLRERARAAVGQ